MRVFPDFKKQTCLKSYTLLFSAGINLTLLNFIMVQHVSVAIRHSEMAVLIFTLSFFSGISVGYYCSDRVSFRLLDRLMPVFMAVQMAALIFLQPLSYIITREFRNIFSVSYTFAETFSYIFIYLLLTIGVTSFYAVFLPRIIKTENISLKRCYSVEISGSLVGLILLPFITRYSHTLLLGFYFLVFLCIGSILRVSTLRLAIMVSFVTLFLFKYDGWDKQASGWFYKNWYDRAHVQKVIYTRFTPYHKIEVARLRGNRNMLLLNGKRQFSAGSHYTYSYFVAEYPARLLGKPEVLLLGCGSMSTVGRIGDFVPSVRIVDIDEYVFKTSSRFFKKFNRLDKLRNWTFEADDAKHFLAKNKKKFDLIMHDIPPARSRQTALTYTKEFFSLVKEDLSEKGIFSISSLSPSRSEYSRRMLFTLTTVFDEYFIIRYRKDIYFYGGKVGLYQKNLLKEAVISRKRRGAEVYLKDEVDRMVKGAKIITVGNVGDLIFAK